MEFPIFLIANLFSFISQFPLRYFGYSISK